MRAFRLILVAGVLISCGSLSACLNDSELADHEREFRSQYLQQPLMTSSDPPPHRDGRASALSVAGLALLSGAFGLTWFGRRSGDSRS